MSTRFLDNWYNILRNCNYDNTYKMSWAKAIVEIGLETNYSNNNDLIEITLEQIAHKIIKYYWNQTIFFNLIQGSNPLKPPKIISITKELIEKYQDELLTMQPVRFERIEYLFENNAVLFKHYTKAIKKIVSTLKSDVSYRFLNISGKKILGIYQYKKGDNKLYIKKENLKLLKSNSQNIFDTINYRWSLILETFNSTPRICKKVKIIDDIDIKRRPLNRFMKYLDLDNQQHRCFICGDRIDNTLLSIDHVIPWSYLYSDDLWNLVYTHKSCNSAKNNIIPEERFIRKLEERNRRLLNILDGQSVDKNIEELRLAVGSNYVRKFWIGCQ